MEKGWQLDPKMDIFLSMIWWQNSLFLGRKYTSEEFKAWTGWMES